jgi:hypothetical protein
MDSDDRAAADDSLAAVLKETRNILGDAPVCAADNFFTIGGTSLDGLELASRLQAEHGLEVDLADVFAAGSLAEVAAATRLVEQ